MTQDGAKLSDRLWPDLCGRRASLRNVLTIGSFNGRSPIRGSCLDAVERSADGPGDAPDGIRVPVRIDSGYDAATMVWDSGSDAWALLGSWNRTDPTPVASGQAGARPPARKCMRLYLRFSIFRPAF